MGSLGTRLRVGAVVDLGGFMWSMLDYGAYRKRIGSDGSEVDKMKWNEV